MKESIGTLFIKYLDGNCNDTEVRLLLKHFNLPESEVLLKEAILSELETRTVASTVPSDLDTRITTVHDKVIAYIRNNNPVKQPFYTRIWPRVSAVAAVFVVIASVIFYNTRPQPLEKLREQEMAAKIRPGRNQAVLILANGTRMQLSNVNGKPVYIVPGTSAGADIEYNTIEAPVGGQWQVVLPDSTHVWLNAKSKITFPTVFRSGERKVEVQGEAYFEVAHNKMLPFRVRSAGQTVEVLGTKFNIMAYQDEAQSKTTLLEGSVKIAVGKEEQILKPGEQAMLMNGGVKIEKDVDVEGVVAWKNGYFKFNGNIEDIMSKISRWYNVPVVYESKPDPAYKFEGEISRSRDLSEILKIMQYTGKVQFEIEGRRIIVQK